MYTQCQGFLLDEQQGSFVGEDGRKVDYHNARFFSDADGTGRIFKARIPDDAALPQPREVCELVFRVDAGERYCRLSFAEYMSA